LAEFGVGGQQFLDARQVVGIDGLVELTGFLSNSTWRLSLGQLEKP